MIKEEKNPNLKNIVENRQLPGLLIFDKRTGEIIFRNSNNDSTILNEKAHRDWIVEQLNCTSETSVNKSSGQHDSAELSEETVLKTVICSDNHFYSVRAFLMGIEIQGEDRPVVAVLIEKISEEISSERLKLHRLCHSFHFSPRETEVLEELQLGRTDKMIAKELQISPETVHGYVKSIRGKLGVSTRTAIMHKLLTI